MKQSVIVKSIHGENITQLRHRLESEMDVVTEDEPIADRHDVLSDAVVGRRDPLRRQELGWDRAKNCPPFLIQLTQAALQCLGVGRKA